MCVDKLGKLIMSKGRKKGRKMLNYVKTETANTNSNYLIFNGVRNIERGPNWFCKFLIHVYI